MYHFIRHLQTKDKSTNEEMERWISECYKKEVDSYVTKIRKFIKCMNYSNCTCSVSTLSEVLRQAIENEDKLINELALPGGQLMPIDYVNYMYKNTC